MTKIILASGSPRRKKLLSNIYLDFECILADDEENISKVHFSYDLIEKIAIAKVNSVYNKIKDNSAIIIGADTVVVLGDEIMTKPVDEQDAILKLQKLSGKTHFVVTAHAIRKNKQIKSKCITSYVTFNELSLEDIKKYVSEKKPLDKAGAYGIQELPQHFIKDIKGDINNIIGLSTDTIKEMIKNI